MKLVEKPIDAHTVKQTFRDFRGTWDWYNCPVLRLPIWRHSVRELPLTGTTPQPAVMEYAEYRYEVGWLNGEEMERIVGTVPGMNLSVVVVTQPIKRRP